MKHVALRSPIHAQNCQCPRCRHVRGPAAVSAAARAGDRLCVVIALTGFALLPGRWIAAAAWAALSPTLPF